MGPRLQTKDETLAELISMLTVEDKERLKEIQKQSVCIHLGIGYIYALLGGTKLSQRVERMLNKVYSYTRTKNNGTWHYIFGSIKDKEAWNILTKSI